MTSKSSNHVVWIDMEFTGLDIEKDTILEVACIITDKELNIISNEYNLIINQPDIVLETMNDWCIEHHAKSGLIEESKSSHITIQEAEQRLLNFLKNYIPKGVCPLAGNTVYVDRLFLNKFMPLADDYLHYRIIDISSIKEIARRWYPTIYKNLPKKRLYHRALMDIKESIEELRYYKENLFIPRQPL